ncbi:UDP-N-acetylglucosamine--peptide N-acetylglucosaminyltransferase 110 kDa subunit [Lachnellula cervina]|uniref:UDP-N-acetylglucosamine--peptide N-acetylglucosaminyltransferase 110 kDa subunit n=1 Tax=Lachnellula cervina TaxID=1316786 RepID=A0A7D8YSS8_9HELO|nr:UDP-N-acetylglucosamine--peptide N-acetylglucosaminyltransferase 110 kDa subunit [Lachnellula cervina]
MIPQIAQHPRLSQQFGSHGFAVPPFEPLPSPRRFDQPPAPLPFRNPRDFGPSAPTQPHRTYPLDNHAPRRTGLAPGGSAEQGFGSQYNDPSEHMLRRKTPNGTLAAGYDAGTPLQWSSKAPALKHVILPLSGTSANRNDIYSPAVLNGQHSRRRSGPSGWSHPQSNQYGRVNGGNMEQRITGEMEKWTHHPPVPDVSHNVWDHIGIHQPATYYPNNGTQIPTVLQPPYQASPGPTASNDGGLYGPYWPDGKFVPYRPAAFRGQGNHYSMRDSYLEGTPQNHPQTPADLMTTFRQPTLNLELNPSLRIGNPAFQFQENGASVLGQRFETPTQPLRIDSTAYLQASEGSRTPTAESVNKASNHRFKEKTLSWAHSIYVDLLAFLHQSKKESRNSGQSTGSRTYSKTSIYPKPPRQPASYLGASQWAGLHSGPSDSSSSRHVGSMLSPTDQTGASGDYNDWQGGGLRETRRPRISHNDGRQYMSPFQTPQYPAINALHKAKEALELLTSLCEQSGWCWIDGMLLGGCLAYGLEQYHNSLEWYSKIIAIDPNCHFANSASRHVEAISNLAATLLCLNRREEAEQHWLQSVKLRPSYFEAVEHLIGLLCGDHRGNEAVAIIDFVERSLRLPKPEDSQDYFSETSSNADRESSGSVGTSSEIIALDYDGDGENLFRSPSMRDGEDGFMQPGFGSSGFSVPGSENGRILALVHAKGNMLYALGDVNGASKAFEDAVLISAGRGLPGIQGLIRRIVNVLTLDGLATSRSDLRPLNTGDGPSPLLLTPDKALQTAKLVFAKDGDLPGLSHVPHGLAKKAAISTTSNSLLSLAKIFQDAMSNSSSPQRITRMPTGVGDILALYYLSLSLQPSPSTANNVGILLASVQQPAPHRPIVQKDAPNLPAGIVPGSGVALALAYYNYGLLLDARHAHIYTNLGSLLKDIGQLSSAITMYEKAVACDSSFDIALANLANAVKDQGRTSDAIEYYRRAVASSPDFAEAVCGLANALNSVCDWAGRGGVLLDGGRHDRWHVDETGMITEARTNAIGGGWMKRVVDIVAKQLKDGSAWGRGTLQDQVLHQVLQHLEAADTGGRWAPEKRANLYATLNAWAGHRWEGSRIVRLIERAIKRAMHRWYHDKHVKKKSLPSSCYPRPQLPGSLSVPTAPTVLPFHTFTCPLSAKDIRMISQRNALRISCSTLRAPWMPDSVFSPPSPPAPHLNVGYVSSDFNNHPLAHL